MLSELDHRVVDHVAATLNYLPPTSLRPVTYTFEPPPGTPWRNFSAAPERVAIQNGRAVADRLSLDAEGVAFLKHRSRVGDFYDPSEVKAVYYPEAEALVRRAIGAARVLAFDHNVRNLTRAERKQDGAREPVKRVHNDFTHGSGPRRAREVLIAAGFDPEPWLEHRFAAINVWRPIRGPVADSPLAVCDAGSIAAGDLVASDLVYRDRVGETYQVTYNPRHRWWYFPEMQTDEAILIKCYDSALDGPARFAAHSAFDDPTAPRNAPPRESIEVRTFAFFAPEGVT
ncbi:MAG: methyltransferase [Proteobacteria bacterium]|nr:methyltransferase [Pseudomonadota bacterium]